MTRLHRTLAAALGLLLAATATAQTWSQLLPSAGPGPRRTGAAVFDPLNGSVLFYGGLLSPTAINGDTWTFDGTTWTQLLPATTPPPRWGHRMVYDSRRARVVTFGGRSPTTTANANDTWEWNGSDWQLMSPPNRPSVRAFYSMAYDERRGRVVMYGVQSGTVASGGNQTWEYDGTIWTQATTAFTPPGLETPALVYDKGRGVTVMFGGWNGSSPGTMYNSTWEYDGASWTVRTTPNAPSPRYRTSHWYDDLRGRVVVYGGFGNATALQDTWEYDGNDWTNVLNGGPAGSTEGYAAFDPARAQAYHFGGSSPAGVSNQVWAYTGPNTAIFAPFGVGCGGAAGVPQVQAGTPVLGQVFTLNVVNLPQAGISLLAQGFSNLFSALGPLPADLTPFGLGGCRLEVSPDATVVMVSLGGTASLSIGIPNQPSLIGLHYFCQALTPDPTAGNGVATVSRAGRAVVGL